MLIIFLFHFDHIHASISTARHTIEGRAYGSSFLPPGPLPTHPLLPHRRTVPYCSSPLRPHNLWPPCPPSPQRSWRSCSSPALLCPQAETYRPSAARDGLRSPQRWHPWAVSDRKVTGRWEGEMEKEPAGGCCRVVWGRWTTNPEAEVSGSLGQSKVCLVLRIPDILP